MDDGKGRQRGYLASEDSFAFMKALESNNLLVPVVGDFGGPKALRAVGRSPVRTASRSAHSTCRTSSSI